MRNMKTSASWIYVRATQYKACIFHGFLMDLSTKRWRRYMNSNAHVRQRKVPETKASTEKLFSQIY